MRRGVAGERGRDREREREREREFEFARLGGQRVVVPPPPEGGHNLYRKGRPKFVQQAPEGG